MAQVQDFDVIIVGAGPTGLCFARSLAGAGLRLALVEPQSAAQLADPPFDGREIALTHHSVHLLEAMGVWSRIAADDVHALRDATIMDGAGAVREFTVSPADGGASQLGCLVPNHAIRKAAFEATCGQDGLVLLESLCCVAAATDERQASVRLSDGRVLHAPLLVAADSRHSETRRAMGIGARMEDFGRTMLVCRMRHAPRRDPAAWEWFGRGQTLALLPLGAGESSVVLTLPHAEVQALMGLDAAAFDAAVGARFEHRLGAMSLSSTRHAYPLVGVYPRRFVGRRFAVVGDAAVGMHPVTAHGFNLGLLGQDLLALALREARRLGRDLADPRLLAQYERRLWRATRPLYVATRSIVRLYTDDRPPARLLRRAGLAVGAHFAPFRRALAAGLAQEGSSLAGTRPVTSALRALLLR